MVVANPVVNVRVCPSGEGAIVGALGNGAEVDETARCGKWIKHASGWTSVALPDGTAILKQVPSAAVC